MSKAYEADLYEDERDRRWIDQRGYVWYWDTQVGSWVVEGGIQAAVIWDRVPVDAYGPFVEESE